MFCICFHCIQVISCHCFIVLVNDSTILSLFRRIGQREYHIVIASSYWSTLIPYCHCFILLVNDSTILSLLHRIGQREYHFVIASSYWSTTVPYCHCFIVLVNDSPYCHCFIVLVNVSTKLSLLQRIGERQDHIVIASSYWST